MPDYFEMERLVEDLAKLYSTACATSWYKVNSITQPTNREFRDKVADFMKHLEYTLSTFPDNDTSNKFKQYVNELLSKEIQKVLHGRNRDVEKRYKYFINYG